MTPPGFVRNITRGTILASSALLAVTSRERRRGLIGRDRLAPGEGLVIRGCRQVHTFGMRFPIDVVFIDMDGKIIRALTMPPRRLSPISWRARGVIELPAGTVEQTLTRPGDRVLVVTK